MSTSPVIIERISHSLEYFTLAELVFVHTEEARTSPLDKFRVKTIASSLRHTFLSNQSDHHVEMLTDDLSTAYNQCRIPHKQSLASSVTFSQVDHLLTPFRSSCPACNQNLDVSNAIQKPVRLYCQSGSVVIGMDSNVYCSSIERIFTELVKCKDI